MLRELFEHGLGDAMIADPLTAASLERSGMAQPAWRLADVAGPMPNSVYYTDRAKLDEVHDRAVALMGGIGEAMAALSAGADAAAVIDAEWPRGTRPAYKQVDIQITTGSIASLMQSGSINFADFGMTDQQVNSLASAGKNVDRQDTGFFHMFAITSEPTSQVGALGNVLVRRAIAYARPYDELLDNIIYGRGERAGSIVMNYAPEYGGRGCSTPLISPRPSS